MHTKNNQFAILCPRKIYLTAVAFVASFIAPRIVAFLDARLLVVLYNGSNSMQVLLSSHQSVGALPRLVKMKVKKG